MRIFMSADMEGIAGVVSRDNLLPGRFEYERACDWMTDAVLAACETAHAAGAREIVVADAHGNGQNIRFERMPRYVQLVRSWPRPLGMMQGIEHGRFDGAFLLGYHAAGSTAAGTLSHTLSGDLLQEVRLNGTAASEGLLSAAFAGQYGVPVVLLAGDDVATEEARALLGDGVVTACLKTSHGFLSARMLPPDEADRSLRDAVRVAMARIGTVRPHQVELPVVLEIRLRHRLLAEWLGYLDAVERIDAYTIRLVAADMVAVTRFLQFLTQARTALA